MSATALIADDEPLLRERLVSHLARLWPELQVVALALAEQMVVALRDAAQSLLVWHGQIQEQQHQ